MHVDARELAWAAGLFEGEGCISITKQRYPVMKLTMSDEDSVRRFHAAIGGLGAIQKPRMPGRGTKLVWEWGTGRFEHVQAVIALLWYGLGERRRSRAAEVLSQSEYAGPVWRPGPVGPFPVRPKPKPKDPLRCRNGHLRTEESTILRPGGRRECRICNQKSTRESYRRINKVPATAFRKGLQ